MDGFIKLQTAKRNDFYDLEVRIDNKELISVKGEDSNIMTFTIEEIEALYHFSQIVKTEINN